MFVTLLIGIENLAFPLVFKGRLTKTPMQVWDDSEAAQMRRGKLGQWLKHLLLLLRSIKNGAASCTWLQDYKCWQSLQDEIFRIMYCWEDLGGRGGGLGGINKCIPTRFFFFFFLLYGGHKEMSGGWFIWDSVRLMCSRHHNNVHCLLLFLHSSERDREWDQCLVAAGRFVTAGGRRGGGLGGGRSQISLSLSLFQMTSCDLLLSVMKRFSVHGNKHF